MTRARKCALFGCFHLFVIKVLGLPLAIFGDKAAAMEIATLILLKMTGLYIAIAIGWVSARKLEVGKEGISKLLFYVIVPLVFLHGISKMQMQEGVLLLPLIIAVFSCTLCLLYFQISRRFYPQGKEANIIAFASGNGNIGYFGIPIAMMLFDTQTVAIYMVMVIVKYSILQLQTLRMMN